MNITYVIAVVLTIILLPMLVAFAITLLGEIWSPLIDIGINIADKLVDIAKKLFYLLKKLFKKEAK